MPKFIIKSTVTALHRRMIFVDSPDIEQAAELFFKNAVKGVYNDTPEHIEFDTDSATFEIEDAEIRHPDQYNLGLFH